MPPPPIINMPSVWCAQYVFICGCAFFLQDHLNTLAGTMPMLDSDVIGEHCNFLTMLVWPSTGQCRHCAWYGAHLQFWSLTPPSMCASVVLQCRHEAECEIHDMTIATRTTLLSLRRVLEVQIYFLSSFFSVRLPIPDPY